MQAVRLFFALWPSPREQLRFRDAAQDLVPSLCGRWIAPENIHLTLLFLSSAREEWIGPLSSGIDRSLLPRVLLRLDRLLFQPAGKEGLLWLAPTEDASVPVALVESLRARLRSLKIPIQEARPFTPHITLARGVALPHRAGSCRRQPILLHRLDPPIDWSVREMTLVSSETLPEGSRYTPLASWALPQAG